MRKGIEKFERTETGEDVGEGMVTIIQTTTYKGEGISVAMTLMTLIEGKTFDVENNVHTENNLSPSSPSRSPVLYECKKRSSLVKSSPSSFPEHTYIVPTRRNGSL